MANHHKVKTNGNGIKKPQSWDFDYVGCTEEVVLKKLGTSVQGLTESEARKRLDEYGTNEPANKRKRHILMQIAHKFCNPLVIILLIIGCVSFFLGEKVNAALVALMGIVSVVLSFVQEYRANEAAEKLFEMIHTTATVCRQGKRREIKMRELVPGDIVDVAAGDMIPGDIRILSCKDFFVNQSSLTGESFPVEKHAFLPSENAVHNIAFMGSSVVSGSALAVVIKTGAATEFGELAQKLSQIAVETNFDRGVWKFTMLMVKAMLCLVAFIFAVVAIREGDFFGAFLFSLGVAIGLTPEMLPMIVTVTLSRGAIDLSKKEVIVKRLSSIQNFGAMDVLCTDKTGTLTEDKIVLEKHCDVTGEENEDVLRYAYINSFYQTGLKNLLDKAILNHEKLLVKEYEKIDELPFDFSRKIMSVIVRWNGCQKLIAKGAPEEIFTRCSKYIVGDTVFELTKDVIDEVEKEYYTLSQEGFRVLAVAYKDIHEFKEVYSKEDEADLILKGYVAFYDPPKASAKKAIEALTKLGIDFKVLTGDNEFVTKKICMDVGLDVKNLLTGEQLENVTDQELDRLVEETNVFSRLLPIQKDRVIQALHRNGHTVGYLGDGINDALALKTSDVGISVNNAVDIAKESADLILLRKSLMVLQDGVKEGRKTFGNIIKYLKMGASSNFGNMLSMTGASMFLPFLPMLPIQILLNNLLYDFSQIAIPTDQVDKEYLLKPRAWNINNIKNFMLFIGPISSIFDFITFGFLLFWLHSSPALFHTGWFLESLLTQTLVIHIIRTRKIPFLESWPSPFLLLSSLLIVLIGFAIPVSSFGASFGFVVPPLVFYIALFFIVSGYFLLVECVKRWFVKRFEVI